MKNIKYSLITMIFIITLISISTIIYYYDFINLNIYNYIKLIIIITCIFIYSYKCINKIPISIILILFIVAVIIDKLSIRIVIYYLMIMSSSILGYLFSKYRIKEKKD